MIHKRIDIKPLNFDKFFDIVLKQRHESDSKTKEAKSLKKARKLSASKKNPQSELPLESSLQQNQAAPIETRVDISQKQPMQHSRDSTIPIQFCNKEDVPQSQQHITFREITEEEFRAQESKRLYRKYAKVPIESVVDSTLGKHVDSCWCPKCKQKVKESCATHGYKIVGNSKLIMTLLELHGLHRTVDNCKYNILWSSQHLKSSIFRTMQKYQKINMFPRSFECTRKDSLATNLNAMAEQHGKQLFHFVPECYVWPRERTAAIEAINKSKGHPWILKPAGSSQGRGIAIITSIHQLPTEGAGLYQDDNWVVEKYVNNPLLLDGKKFDLRLYVCVTSFNPLRIYLHREGLVRLASEKYDGSRFDNPYVHLTNYSINKYNIGHANDLDNDCINPDNAENENRNRVGWNSHIIPLGGSKPAPVAVTTISEEDDTSDLGIGIQRKLFDPLGEADRMLNSMENEKPRKRNSDDKNTKLKWSLSTFTDKLREMKINDAIVWSRIEDVIVKTLISVESKIMSAVNMFVPFPENCFEVFGFDILLDNHLQPWLMEVNFSPSLNTDSSLDFSVKSKVLVDTFNLIGVKNAVFGEESKVKNIMAESIQQYRQQQLNHTQHISTCRFQPAIHDKKIAEMEADRKMRELASAYKVYMLTPIVQQPQPSFINPIRPSSASAAATNASSTIRRKLESAMDEARTMTMSEQNSNVNSTIQNNTENNNDNKRNKLIIVRDKDSSLIQQYTKAASTATTTSTKGASMKQSGKSIAKSLKEGLESYQKDRPEYRKTNLFRDLYKNHITTAIIRNLSTSIVEESIATALAITVQNIVSFANDSSVVWNGNQYAEVAKVPRITYDPIINTANNMKRASAKTAPRAKIACFARTDVSKSGNQFDSMKASMPINHSSSHPIEWSSTLQESERKILIRILKEFQRSQLGGYDLLFPSVDGYKYLPLLSGDKSLNMLVCKYMFCLGQTAAISLDALNASASDVITPSKLKPSSESDQQQQLQPPAPDSATDKDIFTLTPSPNKSPNKLRKHTPTSPFQHLVAAPEEKLAYNFNLTFDWKDTLRVPYYTTVLGCTPPSQVPDTHGSDLISTATAHVVPEPPSPKSPSAIAMRLRFTEEISGEDTIRLPAEFVVSHDMDLSCMNNPQLQVKWARAIGQGLK